MNKDEADIIITEQNKSTEEILKAVAKVKSDYHELCKLKDMRIAELEAQIEKMKCGQNCKFEYWINTGGCYDQKCRFTGLDCTNCKDKWKGKWEND